jgi:hypothetical protein
MLSEILLFPKNKSGCFTVNHGSSERIFPKKVSGLKLIKAW